MTKTPEVEQPDAMQQSSTSPVSESPAIEPRFHGLAEMIQPPGESVAWANWLQVHKADVVILDTETTDNLDKNRPDKKVEIVSIAVIDLDGNTILNTLVKPIYRNIMPGAIDVHGITMETLEAAGATDFAANFPAIKAAIEGKNIVIYNRDFDKQVLEGCAKLHGVTLPEVKGWHCAMLRYVSHNQNKLSPRGQRGGWWKLTEALEQEGLTVDENAHDALADVQMTRQLILKLATNERDKWSTNKPNQVVDAPKEEPAKSPFQTRFGLHVELLKWIVPNEWVLVRYEDGTEKETALGDLRAPDGLKQISEYLNALTPAEPVSPETLNEVKARLNDIKEHGLFDEDETETVEPAITDVVETPAIEEKHVASNGSAKADEPNVPDKAIDPYAVFEARVRALTIEQLETFIAILGDVLEEKRADSFETNVV